MTAIVFYFQVHQPSRVRKDLTTRRPPVIERAAGSDNQGPASLPGAPDTPDAEKTRELREQTEPLDRGTADSGPPLDELFDRGLDELVLRRVAERCYLPMNTLLREIIEETKGRFRCAFSISGTALDQMERWAPAAVESFQRLAQTGAVEFLGETSHHSLAGLEDEEEFRAQITQHRARIESLFGQRPTTFRNTELILDQSIARTVESLGFDTVLAEGATRLLNGRSAHRPYLCAGTQSLHVITRDWSLSDDIAFRFANPDWDRYPLFADAFADHLAAVPPPNEILGLFMDYETFGEHQSADTGILDFMRHLPRYVLQDSRCRFATPSEAAASIPPAGQLHFDRPVSWADTERDLSAWLGNPMQRDAHESLYRLLPEVRRLAPHHPELLDTWRRLSTSDHVYYMSTKRLSDGDVHSYFSPFDSPFASYAQFTQALRTLRSAVTDANRPQVNQPEANKPRSDKNLPMP